MFPGYVTLYKDNGIIHLYFFPGIDNDGSAFFKDLVLSCETKYQIIKNTDKSIDFIFESSNIKRVTCNLIDNKGVTHPKEIYIRN